MLSSVIIRSVIQYLEADIRDIINLSLVSRAVHDVCYNQVLKYHLTFHNKYYFPSKRLFGKITHSRVIKTKLGIMNARTIIQYSEHTLDEKMSDCISDFKKKIKFGNGTRFGSEFIKYYFQYVATHVYFCDIDRQMSMTMSPKWFEWDNGVLKIVIDGINSPIPRIMMSYANDDTPMTYKYPRIYTKLYNFTISST